MLKLIRRLFYILLIVFIVLIGYLKVNPPLAFGAIGTTADRQSVTVALGNKSFFGEIEIIHVSINGQMVPSELKVQVSESSDDFLLTNLFASTAEASSSEDYGPIILEPNSAPKEDQVSENIVYGLSISEVIPIERIDVFYKFFGLTFEKTIKI